MAVPKSHPRYASLILRERIEDGVRKGITSMGGLIAHGRGEAFDYLLGEKTNAKARQAIKRAASLLACAKHPVISVNGNSAALCPKGLVDLADVLGCSLEVNVFHASKERERKIKRHLLAHGAKKVLLPQKDCPIKYLDSNRRYVHEDGIFCADVVFVPLEDGDRTEALRKSGKKVIVVDLNHLSRSAKKANITIVDNLVRCLPLLTKEVKSLLASRTARQKKRK